jgi:hypothetical protein
MKVRSNFRPPYPGAVNPLRNEGTNTGTPTSAKAGCGGAPAMAGLQVKSRANAEKPAMLEK